MHTEPTEANASMAVNNAFIKEVKRDLLLKQWNGTFINLRIYDKK